MFGKVWDKESQTNVYYLTAITNYQLDEPEIEIEYYPLNFYMPEAGRYSPNPASVRLRRFACAASAFLLI
jgi:hypothetical protein